MSVCFPVESLQTRKHSMENDSKSDDYNCRKIAIEQLKREYEKQLCNKSFVIKETNIQHHSLKFQEDSLLMQRHSFKESRDHNYARKIRRFSSLSRTMPIIKVAPWAAALPAAEASGSEEPAMSADVLEAAEVEAAEGGEVAVVAAADTEAASGGDSPVAAVIEMEDPQDSTAAESGSEASKSKRTIATMLGYGAYPSYNSLPHSEGHSARFQPSYHVHSASQQQPQYTVPSQPQSQHQPQQQQYQTLRYYPTKAAALEQAVPTAGRQQYQIQYQYQLPSAAAHYQPAPQYQHYYPVPQQLIAAASAQPLVYTQHPAAAAPATHAPSAHALFGGQQLIPVILVRVADPSQHGLASAALLPASALGLPAHAHAGHGLGLQGLQGLLLQHYMQQAAAQAAPAQVPAAAYYSQETPQLSQQQLKQLYLQQQAAASAAPTVEGKKPIVPSATPASSIPQKPRKPSSVSIEPAHNLDNSYQEYKFNYKEKN